MTFWSTNNYQPINIGTAPNDGTGDDVRTAFTKVDNNFANISTQLASTTQNFLSANISLNLTSLYANLTNLVTANLTINGAAASTGNITSANLIATTGLYGSGNAIITGNTTSLGNLVAVGPTYHLANTYVSAAIIPTANISYDLGSPTNYFRTIYSQGVVQVNTIQTSSNSSMLEIHANVTSNDYSDVGVVAKYWNNALGAAQYSFFGRQSNSSPQTGNYVFLTEVTSDPTLGNGVVVGGHLGTAQFGNVIAGGAAGIAGNVTAGNVIANLFIGNITSTVANITSMTVANIAGKLYVDSNIYSASYQVLTMGTQGIGNIFNGSGSLFLGNTVFGSSTPSTSTGTGAVVISTGGLGVGGNIYAGGNVVAAGLAGPYYGNVMTNAQPYITSVGTLGNLTIANYLYGNISNFSSVSTNFLTAAGSTVLLGGLSTTAITATGLATLTGGVSTTSIIASGTAALNGGATTSTLIASGNVTAANVAANYYGNIMTNAQPYITSLGTLGNLAVSGNISGTIVTAAQPYITSLGNLTALTVTGGITGTLLTAAQPNVTSLGTLSGLTVSGGITAGGTISASGTGLATLVSNGDITAYRAGGTTGVIFLSNSGTKYLYNDGTTYQLPSQGLNVGGSITATGGYINNGPAATLTRHFYGTGTTTGAAYGQITNTAGGIFWGVENSAGSSLIIGAPAYDSSFGGVNGLSFSATNGAALHMRLTSGGLALNVPLTTTGGINATGGIFANNNGTQATEGDVGAGAAGQNLAYLFNHNTQWGLYSASGGAIISYVRGTNSTRLNSASGAVTVSASIVPTASATYNIGSATSVWGTLYGVATTALYADLAENYTSDAKYAPGTVVIFGGTAELTVTNEAGDERVAGVVSTDPAYLMNSGLTDGLPVALRGRVPCQVIGPVTKGDSLVTSTVPGYAMSVGRSRSYGQAVFAKALETNPNPGTKIITAVIL